MGWSHLTWDFFRGLTTVNICPIYPKHLITCISNSSPYKIKVPQPGAKTLVHQTNDKLVHMVANVPSNTMGVISRILHGAFLFLWNNPLDDTVNCSVSLPGYGGSSIYSLTVGSSCSCSSSLLSQLHFH